MTWKYFFYKDALKNVIEVEDEIRRKSIGLNLANDHLVEDEEKFQKKSKDALNRKHKGALKSVLEERQILIRLRKHSQDLIANEENQLKKIKEALNKSTTDFIEKSFTLASDINGKDLIVLSGETKLKDAAKALLIAEMNYLVAYQVNRNKFTFAKLQADWVMESLKKLESDLVVNKSEDVYIDAQILMLEIGIKEELGIPSWIFFCFISSFLFFFLAVLRLFIYRKEDFDA